MKIKLSKYTAIAACAFLLSASPATSQQINGTIVAPTAEAKAATHRPRVGLALGGGGTRGCAHIGVLEVLEKNGIQVDCIAGTSMGAIVGGLYCAGMKASAIEQLFHGNEFIHAYDTVPISCRVALIPLFFIPHLFGYHPYGGLYRGIRFANFVNNSVKALGPDATTEISALKIPFCAVTSNLVDGLPYAIAKGNFGRALQASSAVPGLRRAVPVDGQLMVDGGVCANLPVDYCRAMGADIVIAVDVDEQLGEINRDHYRKIGTIAYRCLNMHLSAVDYPQLKHADIVIHPDVAGIELLSRRFKDIELSLKQGRKATEEAIPVIKQQIDKKLAEMKVAN